jgi:transaldolase
MPRRGVAGYYISFSGQLFYKIIMELYADTSDIKDILDIYENYKLVTGFTTNPTLMRKAGVTNYEQFAKELTAIIPDRPISFEIFADEKNEMEYQIEKVAGFGENVYVKVPITNTRGEYCLDLISKMSGKGIKLNVTALFTVNQIVNTTYHLDYEKKGTPAIISIFAGRIADTGVHPSKIINTLTKNMTTPVHHKILWASVREVYNIYEAQEADCDIVTVTPDILKKYFKYAYKSLASYSLETVKMFFDDAKAAGYTL